MKQLIKRAMNQDADAFVKLMEENTVHMYRVARGFLRSDEDIADALQDTILTCFEKMHTLQEPKYFRTWMIRILINHCNDILRQKKKECCFEEKPEIKDPDAPMEYLEFTELLGTLADHYREIIVLYYVDGFKIHEIAAVLNLNEATVKTRLRRGRKQLKKLYEEADMNCKIKFNGKKEEKAYARQRI